MSGSELTVETVPGIRVRELAIEHPDIPGVTLFVALVGMGFSIGGMRCKRYASPADAKLDVLRLAWGMWWKNNFAGIPFSGGKSVLHVPGGIFDELVGDPARLRALYEWAGRMCAERAPSYHPSWDMGMNEELFGALLAGCPAALGRPGMAHDPAPYTSAGVVRAMEVAVAAFGYESLAGWTVLQQGLGATGMGVAKILLDRHPDIRIVGTDVREDPMAAFRRISDACETKGSLEALVACGKIARDRDRPTLFAPCAAGGVYTDEVIGWLGDAGVRIGCGSANNPHVDQVRGPERLLAAGVFSVPAELANLGGVSIVGLEGMAVRDADVYDSKPAELFSAGLEPMRRSYLQERIGRVLVYVLNRALREHRPPEHVARHMVRSGHIRTFGTFAAPWQS